MSGLTAPFIYKYCNSCKNYMTTKCYPLVFNKPLNIEYSNETDCIDYVEWRE